MEPKLLYNYAIAQEGEDVVLVYPDQGAVDRNKYLGLDKSIALCSKKRDSETGKLSGFKLEQGDLSLDVTT
jgi:phosphoribosylpyrophosphate synthetase